MNASTASLRESDRIRWDIKGEALGLAVDNFQVFDSKQSQEIKRCSSEDTRVSVWVIFDIARSSKP